MSAQSMKRNTGLTKWQRTRSFTRGLLRFRPLTEVALARVERDMGTPEDLERISTRGSSRQIYRALKALSESGSMGTLEADCLLDGCSKEASLARMDAVQLSMSEGLLRAANKEEQRKSKIAETYSVLFGVGGGLSIFTGIAMFMGPVASNGTAASVLAAGVPALLSAIYIGCGAEKRKLSEIPRVRRMLANLLSARRLSIGAGKLLKPHAPENSVLLSLASAERAGRPMLPSAGEGYKQARDN